jgi:hypothetical protein
MFVGGTVGTVVNRIVYRRSSNGYEEKIAMKDLVEGETFRIVAEDPEDLLYGKGALLYTAVSDGYTDDDGNGTVVISMTFGSKKEDK